VVAVVVIVKGVCVWGKGIGEAESHMRAAACICSSSSSGGSRVNDCSVDTSLFF